MRTKAVSVVLSEGHSCMHAVKIIRQELEQLKEKPHIEGALGSAPGGAPGVKEALQKVSQQGWQSG